jgi:hypothetical protein
MHEREEESVLGFGRKARRKETTWKTKAWMDGWMGSEWILERLVGKCRVDLFGSG